MHCQIQKTWGKSLFSIQYARRDIDQNVLCTDEKSCLRQGSKSEKCIPTKILALERQPVSAYFFIYVKVPEKQEVLTFENAA